MKRPWKLVAVIAALAVTVAACGDDDDSGGSAASDNCESSTQEGPTVKIGAQDFGESAILAAIYAGALQCGGIDAETVEVGGNRELLFDAIDAGDVNFAPDYVASELEFLNGGQGQATSDVDETLAMLEPLLTERDLVAFDPSDAVDTNAFVMTADRSEELGITSLSDLADHEDLTLGAPQDCEDNQFCLPGLERVYDVDLSENFTPLEAGPLFDALQSGDVDVATLFSTDGRIAEEGLVLLDDDRHMLAADNIFPLATRELADAYGDTLSTQLDKVSSVLTTDDLIEMNKRYDVDHEDAEDIANDWLADHDLS
jgi:osmoprotectant transport system substrate-binding protein